MEGEAVRRADPQLAVGVEVTLVPLVGRLNSQGVTEIADATPAATSQMCDGAGRALPVVGDHGIGDQGSWFAVDEDDRGAAALFGDEVSVVGAGRDDDQTVDPAINKSAGKFSLPTGVLIKARSEQQHAAIAHVILN